MTQSTLFHPLKWIAIHPRWWGPFLLGSALMVLADSGPGVIPMEGATPIPVPAAIKSAILGDVALTRHEKEELLKEKDAYQSFSIDLNGDREMEILVRANSWYHCGSGGCAVWVYRPRPGGYQPLLHAFGLVEVQNTMTHGYRDLVVRSQGGIFNQSLRTYRWNGTGYQEADCIRLVADPNTHQQTQRPCH